MPIHFTNLFFIDHYNNENGLRGHRNKLRRPSDVFGRRDIVEVYDSV